MAISHSGKSLTVFGFQPFSTIVMKDTELLFAKVDLLQFGPAVAPYWAALHLDLLAIAFVLGFESYGLKHFFVKTYNFS
jgi:hypothetical protein